jgi:hypothetical protein
MGEIPCRFLLEVFMFMEFRNPIPVVTPMGDGYAIYVRDGGTFENDIFSVALEDGGKILHFRSDQILMHVNATFDIKKKASL